MLCLMPRAQEKRPPHQHCGRHRSNLKAVVRSCATHGLIHHVSRGKNMEHGDVQNHCVHPLERDARSAGWATCRMQSHAHQSHAPKSNSTFRLVELRPRTPRTRTSKIYHTRRICSHCLHLHRGGICGVDHLVERATSIVERKRHEGSSHPELQLRHTLLPCTMAKW